MRTLNIAIILFVAFISKQIVWASEEFEVNPTDRKVYFLPQPTVEITAYDLGNDGTVILLLSEYKSEDVNRQFKELTNRYPGMSIHRLEPRAAGDFVIQIPELNVNVEARVMNGQVGAYFNAEINLTATQWKQIAPSLKSKEKQPSDIFKITAPIQFSYLGSRVVETYKTDSDICEKLNAAQVKDVVLGLALIEQPSGLQYSTTFDDYKKNVLSSCFELSPSNSVVNSFEALLNLKVVTVKPKSGQIIGHTVKNQKVERVVNQNLNIIMHISE